MPSGEHPPWPPRSPSWLADNPGSPAQSRTSSDDHKAWLVDRPTCLVVDDEPAILEMISVNLEAEGMSVQTAANAEEGERIACETLPDVIILDVMMPGRDGYQVLKALKSTEATSGIPVVLLTAKATDAEVWRGWNSGADYYITKPFNIDELIHHLRQIFKSAGSV